MSKGTIYPLEDKPKGKCRKWKLQAYNGRDLATGKYKRIYRTVEGTYTQAQKELRLLLGEIEKGKVAKKRCDLFVDYADKWLEQRKLIREHATWSKNVDHVKCAKLHLADARMSEITPQVIETVYRKLLDGESPSGRKLSGTYVECIARTLHKLFSDAIKDGVIAINPCDDAEKPKNDTPERKALPTSSIYELIEKLDPRQPTQLVVLLGIKAGICRAEAHGLSWGDIDGDCIHIRHNFDEGGNLKTTKVKKRTRTLPLTDSVKEDLKAARTHLQALFDRYNKKTMQMLESKGVEIKKSDLLRITDETPVICDGHGNRLLPHASSQWWTRHRSELGFDDWTIHDMRHSYLSELARRKIPIKVLQELAGHEKGSTTMDIYLHANDEDKRKAVAVVDW
ncbi:tyrosine-type recombinase/integrase [Xiamenia xianingshaonis]|nr:tyrosine-type recombinase/integrase [Xiamenia xianingshaonis]QTU84941.1 tyrosine-type recombinase/integrase [Xiamenia xianingshaonis]